MRGRVSKSKGIIQEPKGDCLLESIRWSNYGDTPFKNVAFVDQTGGEAVDGVFAKICDERAIRTSRRIDAKQGPIIARGFAKGIRKNMREKKNIPLSCFWRRRLAWDAMEGEGREEKKIV